MGSRASNQPPKVTRVLAGGGALLLAMSTAAAYAANYEGTSGDDTFVAQRGSSTASLKAGDDSFSGAPGNRGGGDHVWGGPDNDDIKGRTFVDQLRGQGGEDTLDGGGDRDGLRGGPGDDTLIGGGGVDRFVGGSGTDLCIAQPQDLGLRTRCENVQFTGP
jgi:serralysin